jgi:VWFA-related protein
MLKGGTHIETNCAGRASSDTEIDTESAVPDCSKKVYMSKVALLLAMFVAVPAILIRVEAQQPARPAPADQKAEDDLGEPIKVDVNVVNLYCSVRNKQNGLVNTLSKSDFDLTEDGKQQEIKYFSRETDIPLTIGLLVDVSGSQRNLIETERQAAGSFFASVLKKKDVAFLISFGADSELLQDLTGTPRLLQDGLRRLKLNAGFSGINSGPVPTMNHARGTVLYDAVYLAANDMLAKEVGRKAIILITDGEDQGSKETENAAIEAAQKSDAIIYGILYVDRQFYGGMGMGYGGAGVLKHMADATGGHLFQVDRKNTLETIFDQIQQEMRTQYLVGYTPTNPKKDGSYRKVDLRVHDKDMKVQVRKGYYAMPSNQ